MSDEPDIDVEFEPEGDAYPDTLSSADGQVHFGVDAQAFLSHWLEKLGCEVTGGALIFGEGCSVAILHPLTGEILTPAEIAKKSSAGSVRRIQ